MNNNCKLTLPEHKYSLLVEFSRDAIFVVTPEMNYIEVNSAACKMLEYTKEELLNLKIPDVASTKYNNEIHVFNKLVKEGNIFSEIHLRTKNGREFPAEINAAILPDGNYLGSVRDITERKKLEKDIIESENKYRKIFESSPNSILICHNLKIIFINKAAVQLLGFNVPEEIIDKNVLNFIKLSYKEKFKSDLDCIVKKDKEICEEYVFIDKKFKEMIVEIKGILFNYKNLKTVFLVMKDISLRKKLQEEQLNLEKLNCLSVFAAGVAHDFNNLLTIIKGNISLVEYFINLGKDPTSKLFEINKAVKQTECLTKQLLTYCKGEEFEKETINIEDILKDSIKLILPNYNIKCNFDLSDNLYPVEIDRSQINQVMNNIVINAVQSMNQEGEIYLAAENIENGLKCSDILNPGKYVKITIRDEGSGISTEDMQKIFDPFFTTKQEGSGLGLAVSYSVIKRHNGYLIVNSELGKGSEFRIYLLASKKKLNYDKFNLGTQLSLDFNILDNRQ